MNYFYLGSIFTSRGIGAAYLKDDKNVLMNLPVSNKRYIQSAAFTARPEIIKFNIDERNDISLVLLKHKII
jgi:hypothetical protein